MKVQSCSETAPTYFGAGAFCGTVARAPGRFMLKPKLKILIVYGHDLTVRDSAARAIRIYEDQGYRIEPTMLSPRELRTGRRGLVFEELQEQFRDFGAALVFMTADDLGIAKEDVVVRKRAWGRRIVRVGQLRPRARQNVVLELGYIIARVGEGRYRIFASGELEQPSDIQGRFLIHDMSADNITSVIGELIEENLGLKPHPVPLEDPSYRLNYNDRDFSDASGALLDLFGREYEQLASSGDRLIYLFERIVFDSYIQRADWWQERFHSVETGDEREAQAKSILQEITRYMAAWRPPEEKNYNRIYSAAENLTASLNSLSRLEPVNPIISLVGYDYLGLAYHKIGTRPGENSQKQIDFLLRSRAALERAVAMAKERDDPNLPLWQGYASFNLARTLGDLAGLDPGRNPDIEANWRKCFQDALDARERYTRCPFGLPLEIQEGLTTELLHARAERIRRASIGVDKQINEAFPYALTKQYILEAEKEYRAWLTDPKRIRVRLAKNVHESWGAIKERFPELWP
jgi:predicted nucleotide-binding protein